MGWVRSRVTSLTEPISEIITYTIFVSTVFGTVFGAVFYIPYRIEKPKKILRQHYLRSAKY